MANDSHGWIWLYLSVQFRIAPSRGEVHVRNTRLVETSKLSDCFDDQRASIVPLSADSTLSRNIRRTRVIFHLPSTHSINHSVNALTLQPFAQVRSHGKDHGVAGATALHYLFRTGSLMPMPRLVALRFEGIFSRLGGCIGVGRIKRRLRRVVRPGSSTSPA